MLWDQNEGKEPQPLEVMKQAWEGRHEEQERAAAAMSLETLEIRKEKLGENLSLARRAEWARRKKKLGQMDPNILEVKR